MTPDAFFPKLPLLKMEFTIQTEKPLQGQYTGSAWRGIMGWEMQKLICPLDRPVKDCVIQNNCPYFMLFEQKSNLSGLSDSPRGYIFYSEQSAKQEIKLYTTLIGYCSQLAPLVIQSLVRAQKRGLGQNANPFKLSQIREIVPRQGLRADKPQVLNLCESDPEPGKYLTNFLQGPFYFQEWMDDPGFRGDLCCSFEIRTPLRLRKQGKYLQDIDFGFLLQSVLRRLEALNCVFAKGETLGREKWHKLSKKLADMANNLDYKKELSWWDYKRYSNRQKKKVFMGGFVGNFTILNPTSEVVSWLRAAELIHIGKGAALGLGAISLDRLPY